MSVVTSFIYINHLNLYNINQKKTEKIIEREYCDTGYSNTRSFANPPLNLKHSKPFFLRVGKKNFPFVFFFYSAKKKKASHIINPSHFWYIPHYSVYQYTLECGYCNWMIMLQWWIPYFILLISIYLFSKKKNKRWQMYRDCQVNIVESIIFEVCFLSL